MDKDEDLIDNWDFSSSSSSSSSQSPKSSVNVPIAAMEKQYKKALRQREAIGEFILNDNLEYQEPGEDLRKVVVDDNSISSKPVSYADEEQAEEEQQEEFFEG